MTSTMTAVSNTELSFEEVAALEVKTSISEVIKNAMQEQNVSIRGLSARVGMKHPQIVRITKCENYTIDTLVKVLDGLNLEVIVQPKRL